MAPAAGPDEEAVPEAQSATEHRLCLGPEVPRAPLPEPGQTIALAKGPGIALLIGGPVTALPVMAVFYKMFHKRVLALYLSICLVATILLAFFWSVVAP